MPKKTARKKRTIKKSARRQILADDLLKLQLVSDPQISPDGTRIVFTKKHFGEKNEYVTNLWIVDTNGESKPRQFTSAGKDGHARWSNDGSRIALISGREKPNPQIFTISSEGGEATPLTKFPEGSIGTFKWSPDGSMLAVSFRESDPDWTSKAKKSREEKGLSDSPRVLDHWWYRMDGDGYFNAQRYGLYIVDTNTGEYEQVYDKDTLGFFSFDFSPDSKNIAIASNRDKRASLVPWNDDLLILNVNNRKLKQLKNLPRGPKASLTWSPNGKLLAYAGRVGPDSTYGTENLELWVCDPKTGRARCLTGNTDYCLMAMPFTDTAEIQFSATVVWSPDSKRIFAMIGWHGANRIASIPTRGGKVQFHTPSGIIYSLGNIAKVGNMLAMTQGTSTELEEIHVARFAPSLKSKALTNFNGTLLKSVVIAKPQAAWIRSEDGNKIHVWCMKPPNFKRGKKYPAVLEIHGGPHAQYGWGYFHEFQMLAANGYVVFYSNPRGSKGYGRDFCHAIRGHWGNADWVDMQAVTEHMRGQPYVNSKRMGVMGGSYGGYMTNWIIGHTDEFRAAITDRCVSNLHSMFGNSDFLEGPDIYWPGNSWDRPEKLWDQSPLKYFGNVKTPTLIIHSEGDLRCNIEQAEQVFAVLNQRRIPSRFVRYPRSTSHGMSRGGPPDMRLHRLHQILDWWKKYLK